MIWTDVVLGNILMFLFLFVPGYLFVNVMFKEFDFAKKFVLAPIFGSIQILIIYFLLKNGLATISGFLVVLVFVVLSMGFILNDGRRVTYRFR